MRASTDAVARSCFPVWLLALLLVLATILAYQPAWHAGFIWDDDVYVTGNKLLTDDNGLWRIWFSLDSPSQYFPLVYTAFRVEHALWGLNPAGYHWVNILLHVTNALLLWRLLARMRVPGAWLAAAIFALHPVQVESVAWITELKNVLMLFFFLLTLLAWVEFLEERDKRWGKFYALALIFYALALCAKTTACTLPAALLLMLWLKKRPVTRGRLMEIAPFMSLGIGMGLLTVWWERYHQGTQGGFSTLGLMERILLASRAGWFYAGKLLWPANLTFSYPRWTISATNPGSYLWLLATIGLGAAIYCWRRHVGRSIEVAGLFFVATLSPVLGFIMLYTFRYSFVADHYQYVASIGPIALFSAGLAHLAGSLKQSRSWLEAMVCTGLLVVLGTLSWQQARIYYNAETLWQSTVRQNPDSWMAHLSLGGALEEKGQTDEAIRRFREAIRLKPDLAEAYCDLGNALGEKGQADEAIQQYQEAIRLKPDFAEAFYNLGSTLGEKGQTDEAIRYFQEAIRLKPNLADAHNNLGSAFGEKGQIDEAIRHFQEAIRLKPDFVYAYNNLGCAFLKKGQADEAISQFQEAIRLKPNYADAHCNLGNALRKQGETNEAVKHYQRAIELRPDFTRAHYQFGLVLQSLGKFAAAVAQFQKVLALDPMNMAAQNNLAWLLATCPDNSVRDGEKAVELAQEAVQLSKGQFPKILETLAAAYAEAGRFPAAIVTANCALNLSATQNNKPLADAIETQLKHYKEGSPFRDISTNAAQ